MKIIYFNKMEGEQQFRDDFILFYFYQKLTLNHYFLWMKEEKLGL